MDYEDNDFQSQSFQLAVEENVNFSPGSHSYSLPKFDLDDNLQVHLRFDSLVESEVLLGIRSQEENHWIEDFSRESSGLEFSSGAAESCSISRRNNVWSEATSSESVDLLLKSVGQDEIVMGKVINEKPGKCDGLDGLTYQMKPSLNEAGLSPSQMVIATCVDSSKLDEPNEHFPELYTDAVDRRQIDSPSHNDEGEISTNGHSRVIVSDEEEKFGGCLSRNENCFATGLQENTSSVDKSEVNTLVNDSVTPECMQINLSTASLQSDVNAGESNSDVPQRSEGLEKGDSVTVRDHQVLSSVMTCQSSEVQLDATDARNLSTSIQEADSSSQMNELSSDAMCTAQISEYEHSKSTKDTEMVDRFIGYPQEASVLRVEGVNVAHSSDVESVPKQEDLSKSGGHQLDDGTSVSKTEQLLVEEKTVFQGQGIENSDDHVGHSSSLVIEMCASNDLTQKSKKPEDIKERDDGEGVRSAEACSSSFMLLESHKKCDPISMETGPRVVDLCGSDNSKLEKETGRFPINSEPALVVPEVANMASNNIVDGVHHMFSRGNNVNDEDIQQKEDSDSPSHVDSSLLVKKDSPQKEDSDSPSHVESSLVVKKEEILTGFSMLDGEESFQTSNEGVPSPNSKHGEVCETATEIQAEIVGLSSSSVCQETGRFPSKSEPIMVASDVANMASDDILDGDHYLLSKGNNANDEDLQQKEDHDSPSRVDSSLLDGDHYLLSKGNNANDEDLQQKEDHDSPSRVDSSLLAKKEDSVISISDTEESKRVSNEGNLSPKSELDKVCEKSSEIQAEIVGHFSSSLCRSERESEFTKIESQQQCSKQLDECHVNQVASPNETEGAEVCENNNNERMPAEAEGRLGREETPRDTLPSTLSDSSHDLGPKEIEDNESTDNGFSTAVASTEGVSLDGCEGTIGAAALSDADADAEGHVPEAESSRLNSNEPNCGSPTIISCSETLQSEEQHLERNMGSMDRLDSDALEQEANIDRYGTADPKGNADFENDKSFSFKVNSLDDLSDKATVSGWKPFPSTQPCETHQCVGSSGTAASILSETDPKILEDIRHGISDETHASASLNHNSEDKTRPTAGKTAESGTTETGKPQVDDFPYIGKGHHEMAGKSDPSTTVSAVIGREVNADASTLHDPKESTAVEVNTGVPFEVKSIANLDAKETSHRWKPVHSVKPHEFPQTVGMSSTTTSFIRQIDAKELQEMSRECRSQSSSAKNVRRSYKSNAEDKTRLSFGKAVNKENDNEGKIIKETASLKRTKAGGSNSICVSAVSPEVVIHPMQEGEIRTVALTEGSSIKSSFVTTPQTSNLPDLNSSVSSYAPIQQPFTDFQQVQLRAQIFVYGSIIQGAAPDETCMLAAFGESDGGRSAWENVWRLTVERLHQKSPLSSAKTPVHTHTGARSTEALRQTVHRSEAVTTPGVINNNKFPSVAFNLTTPLSSPIWTVSAVCRDGSLPTSMPKGPLLESSKTLLPLQPYQSPQVRHYGGITSPWPSQAPSPGTWVGTPQAAAVVASVHHPTLSISETVRVTSVRESSEPHRSGKLHAPSSVVHTGSPLSGPAGKSLVLDAKRTTASPAKNASGDSKPRKKRRNMASENAGQISNLTQTPRDPISVTAQTPTSVGATSMTSATDVSSLISGNYSMCSTFDQIPGVGKTELKQSGQIASLVQPQRGTVSVIAQSPVSVVTTAITSAMNVASGSHISGTSRVFSAQDQMLGSEKIEPRISFPEERCGKIEQAKRHAEDAAAHAATTVGHCQSIWSQLAVQKNSGVVLDVEAKLKSSAAAIAAAASVAKAAAAVAKVASEAALQAKLMADEAMVTSRFGNPVHENPVHDDVKNMGRVTPSSILKGRDQTTNADSVFVAVREAARKRVESASAAAKRAENLNAVLKAAELTAEAVSQAGIIIAMGEPLPFTLTELVDAGPESYWKVQQKSSEQLLKSNSCLTEQTSKDGFKEGVGRSDEQFIEKPSNNKQKNEVSEPCKDSAQNQMLPNGLQWGPRPSSRKGLEAQKGSIEYESLKPIGVIPDAKVVSGTASFTQNDNEGHQPVRTSYGKKFEEGSLVEVRSDEEGRRLVWFSAKVLSLKDGGALVSYPEHARHEGSGQPTEWVPLDDQGGNAPRIRIPHPMSVTKYDGAKKRNRADRGDYNWSVGDKVDAWMRNGWWEGIITDKSKEDETQLSVHFPAQQETSLVSAWNLRPSLIWEDGKWIEWCRPMEGTCLSNEGKPPKKSRIERETDAAVEGKGKAKMTKLSGIMELGKPDALKPSMLSAKEKVFNAGKTTTKVNFGVPKPGRKRKYMDVKHCISDRGDKISKPTMLKSGKAQVPALSSIRDGACDSLSSKKKAASDVAAELRSKEKVTPLGEKFVKNNERVSGSDHFGNSLPNAAEPRRSNRRIQPTSRLLEGLQSSLTVSKIPSASHGKGTKPQQRSSRGGNHG